MSVFRGWLRCRLAALAGFRQDLLYPRRVLVDVLNIIVVDLHHGVFIFDRGNDNRRSLLSYVVSFSIPDLCMKNVSQRETHFDGERQNPHSRAVRIVRFTVFQRRGSDGGVAGRSVGLFRASLHAYGGTFDSVTCHQRRYHCLRLRIVALSRAVDCNQRGVARSALICSPPGRSASWRTRCLAPRKQNVSACPIWFL